jgi:hypothetical protein
MRTRIMNQLQSGTGAIAETKGGQRTGASSVREAPVGILGQLLIHFL